MVQLLKIHRYLEDFNHKYVLMINACFPFLKVSTIKKFIKLCIKNNGPCFSVFERKKLLFRQKYETNQFFK